MDRFCFYLPVLKGRTEALIVNFYECTYLLFHDLPERRLGKGDYGETYPKAELSREAFFALRRILEEKFSGVFESGGYPGLDEEEGLRELTSGDILKHGRVAARLSKEETFAVLRREHSPGTALNEERGYEIYDYFEEEVLLSALRAFRDGQCPSGNFAIGALRRRRLSRRAVPTAGRESFGRCMTRSVTFLTVSLSFVRKERGNADGRWGRRSHSCAGSPISALTSSAKKGRPFVRTGCRSFVRSRSVPVRTRATSGSFALQTFAGGGSTIFRWMIRGSTRKEIILFFLAVSFPI